MRTKALVLIVLLLLSTAMFAADKVYVCPMPEHAKEFSEPGNCPICGMQLVEKSKQLQVAVLLFDNVEDIDFAAPYEVLGQAGAHLFTVASSTTPIRTVFGQRLQPEFDLEHAPAADLVLVPGGGVNGPMGDAKVVEWIRQRAATAKYVVSVCNGAFIIAQAGLLDGKRATTTAGRIDQLAETFPKIEVVRERFVDNGKIITAAGLSAGIDGALHVVEREYGRERAGMVARGIEYHWEPESHWSRANDAEFRLPDVKLPDDALWEKLSSRGDTSQWEVRGRLRTELAADAIFDLCAKQLTAKGWSVTSRTGSKLTLVRKDQTGQPWEASFTAAADAEPSAYMEVLAIRKVTAAAK
jgi:putative intracellular protease/amidase